MLTWGFDMLRTITVGSCVSIQGLFVEALPNGKIAVKVGDTVYAGRPVATANKAALSNS
jgi:hypothetical protein